MVVYFRVLHMRGIILMLLVGFGSGRGRVDLGSLWTACRLTRLAPASVTHNQTGIEKSASVPDLSGGFSARDFEGVD